MTRAFLMLTYTQHIYGEILTRASNKHEYHVDSENFQIRGLKLIDISLWIETY